MDDFNTAIYTITTSDRVHKHDNDMQCKLRIIMKNSILNVPL